MTDDVNTAEATGAAFAFVQTLAGELNKGDLVLPSFPEAVARIRSALEDENCSAEKLARIAGSEAALASRLLRMSNSALLQRGNAQVTDLRTAINRLGFVMVRNAAMSLAVEQITNVRELGSQRKLVKALWKESTMVAALSFVIARSFTNLNPDEAFLAGLLHNVGKLYILTRAANQVEFLSNETTLRHVLDQWHGAIGRSIIESWGFSDAQAAAAEDYADLERNPGREPDLTDVVQMATVFAAYDAATAPPIAFNALPSARRLGLTAESGPKVVEDSNAEILALVEALRG